MVGVGVGGRCVRGVMVGKVCEGCVMVGEGV